MTWQRIDDDTFIDDSLVTCAEYQLFIDEMREQRKYHQPDHWTSYQFPKSHAHKPILGVRFWDAIAFCDWLTKRDEEKRVFRLPSVGEVDRFFMKQEVEKPIGYWILSEKNKYGFFVLHNEHHINIRKLSLVRALDLDPKLAQSFENANTYHYKREVPLPQAFDQAFTTDRELDLGHYRKVLPRDLDSDRASNITQALDNFRNLALERAYTIDINLYADLLTLRERIAGRSPAFEGIRLVKERIK